MPTNDAMNQEMALLDKARLGDEQAILDLINRYHPDLKRFAIGVCQNSEDAEDAVQHALIVMSTRIGMFRGMSKFSTWIFAVIKHECAKMMRRVRGLVGLDETLVDPAMAADLHVERADLMDKVLCAVGRLEPEQRDVFLLRDVEGLSAYEVAQRLDLSLAAMKSRLHRARQSVKASVAGLV